MKTTTELETENAALRRMVNRLREQLTKALETLSESRKLGQFHGFKAMGVAPVTEGRKG